LGRISTRPTWRRPVWSRPTGESADDRDVHFEVYRRYPESVAPPATAEVANGARTGQLIDRLIKVRKLITEALFDDLSNNKTPGFDMQLSTGPVPGPHERDR